MKRVGILAWAMACAGCLIVAAGQAHAADPDCKKLEENWRGRYVEDFGVDWDVTQFSCTGAESKLALSMSDLESLTFTPTSLGYSPNFYDMVTKNLRTLRYDPACTVLANAMYSTGTITLCKAFFEDVREDRASTLVHEARHLERGDPRHVTCVGGKFDGREGACDHTFHDGQYQGSGFNLDVFFMNWVLKGSKQNFLSRSVLQSYINYYVPDRFNNVTPEILKKWRGK